MRRREQFIIVAILLGIIFWGIQFTPLSWRYLAIIAFAALTYFATAFVLRVDLQPREWLTVLPLPAMYSLVLGLFYFLLPGNFWSLIIILGLFTFGMYALLLTCNIFAVAKERTIQLLQAAQNIALFISIIISLLGVQVIFSFNWPFYTNFAAIFALHFPLIVTMVWCVKLEEKITPQLWGLSLCSTLLISELALILSFLPIAAWNIALLIMSVFYLILGILHTFLKEKMFKQALRQYGLLTIFIFIMFVVFFPGK